MLTKSDIDKLKKTFATKDDLKRFATKDDLKKFVTKEDLKEELKKYATKDDFQQMSDHIIKEITDVVSGLIERVDHALTQIRSQRISIGDHEERIQKIEDKVFSQL